MLIRIIELAYNARYHKFCSIGMQVDRWIWIEMFENGCSSEATFDFVKCGLSFVGPVKSLALSK